MKRLALLLLLALSVRLLVLPLVGVNNADAVARIFIGWQWLAHPVLITHGGWAPLHFYLIAAALKLHTDPVVSPLLLHLLFSLATAVPLWAFVRREWGESPALFVAAAYLFYPLAFQSGFLAISEVPFVFFVACALYFLSAARGRATRMHAVLAGLSITLAAALRMEAWVLIPLLGLALWRKWNLMILYLLAASLFPVFWMIGNTAHGLDPLQGLTAARDWLLEVEGINENVTARDILQRLLFFPEMLLFGLTPPVFLLCLWGIVAVLKEKKAQAVWMIPFAGLFGLFVVRCVQGLATYQVRYSLVLGLLLLPFSAEAIGRIRDNRKMLAVAVLTILAMLPLSYCRIVLARIAGPSFPNPFPADLEAVPRVIRPTREIAGKVAAYFNERSGGLLIDYFSGSDFYGWKDQCYVALMSRLHPSRLFQMPGGRYQTLDTARLSAFLRDHPSGLLLRSSDSRMMRLDRRTLRFAGVAAVLRLEPVESIGSITIYRYAPQP